MDEGIFESFKRLKERIVPIFRVAIAFLIIFSLAYFMLVPIWGIIIGVLEPWAGFFSILLGIGIISILLLWILTVHTRFGAFMTIVGLVYWVAVPCNWIIKEWEMMKLDFAVTYIVMWIHVGLLGIVVFFGLLVIIGDTLHLKKRNKSIFWGPWVSKFTDMFKHPELTAGQRTAIKTGGLKLLGITAIAVIGILSFSDVYSPAITIRPQDYDITYNFWAMPRLNSSYSPETIDEYNLASPYNTSILAELNEHKVNLDLTFGWFDEDCIQALLEWEAACPDITYRIVLTPFDGLATLPAVVKTTVEFIRTYEESGALDQWKGLCFDIEGIPFAYNWNFTTFEEAVKMWDGIFDYIDEQSVDRGKPIDMECVSIPTAAPDVAFDGDMDLQKKYFEPCYSPDRWSVYAPMIYRCWYEGEKPYGSAMRSENPWDTSYQVYNLLYGMAGSFPPEKLGIYLGITNTSCYGRDLPQPEKISWGESGGLNNLIRDVLISKHFGVREVTFFLLFDAPENEYVMGGVFSSYGMDFLDVLNDQVNVNPPTEFQIYYRMSDDKITNNLKDDWLYNFSQPVGVIQIIMMWIIAFGAQIYVSKQKSKLISA